MLQSQGRFTIVRTYLVPIWSCLLIGFAVFDLQPSYFMCLHGRDHVCAVFQYYAL
jgi:hypothetical protein